METKASWTLAAVASAAALALALAYAPAAAAVAPAMTETAAVSWGDCGDCHDVVAAQLADTQHGKSGFAHRSDRGCETCHLDATEHMDDPENPEFQPRLDRLTSTEQSQVCLSCHENGNRLFWQGSRHETRGVACLECHSVHSPVSETGQLNAVEASEQCFSCHKDVRAETWKSSHHPIREGKISCAECHNPHGAQSPRMVNAVSVNDQCYSCHTEKRGPFLWEHAPVRESCLTCHTPHGSNHLKLQRTSVPYLCQQCHSNTRHPGTLYDAFRLPTLENPATGSNRLFNRACLDCHAAIHGSNHPSSPYLGH
jgi:DmsE family decaheme c-type cytochrome